MRPMLFVCLYAPVAFGTLSLLSAGQGATAPDAHPTSPIGQWLTVDDVTGKVTSVVRISEENGALYGVIEKLVSPDPRDPDPRCTECEGAMKDKPLVGLRILWGLRRSGDRWSAGQIVDPDNGRSYRCEIVVEDGGNKLKVRGYLGFSFLGRTEYWLRKR